MPRAAERPRYLFGQAHAFELGQVRRVFNHAVANDARHCYADGVNRIGLTLEQGFDFVGQ